MRKIIVLFMLIVCNYSLHYAQPYILNIKSVVDTSDYTVITDSIKTYNITEHLIQRIDLLTGDEFEIFKDGEVIKNVISLKQDSLALVIQASKWTIYDIVNNQTLFTLPNYFDCIYDALLFNNNLYVFECDRFITSDFHSIIAKINLLNNNIDELLAMPYYGSINNMGINYSNIGYIYIEIEDTNYIPLRGDLVKLATFSTTNDQIINISSISNLGVQNADGYLLHKGNKNIGVIESYWNSNKSQTSYFRTYNFINNSGSGFLAYNGYGEPFIASGGKYLIIESKSDSAGIEYSSGIFSIYDVNSSLLLKTIELPSNGKVHHSEIYPNNIYYVKDIELPNRQIYKLKMDSLFNVLDLTSLSPSSKIVNSPPFTLTVNGHGFDTLSTVYFNGGAKTTTYVNDSVLTASISTSDISVVGNYPVWVTDEWGTSDTLMFAVTPQPADLQSLSPAIALTYDPYFELEYFMVTVNGNNFNTSSVIYFGGNAKTTTFVSSTTLTFQARSYDVGVNAHTTPLWVSNSGAISDTLTFYVQTGLSYSITPEFYCVKDNGDETFTARLGYVNPNTVAVFIPIGTKNRLVPGWNGLPQIYYPGEHLDNFTIDFDGGETVWELTRLEASFSKKSDQCE